MIDYDELKNQLLEVTIKLYTFKNSDEVLKMFEGELQVLAYLFKSSEEVIPSMISAALELSRARVTSILTSLEQKQMVILKRSPEDKRKLIVEISDLGEDFIITKLENLEEKILNVLKEIGPDKSSELVNILNEIYEIISRN